jgi:hypothetical protein
MDPRRRTTWAWLLYWSEQAHSHEAHALGWAQAGHAIWSWERAALALVAHVQAAAFLASWGAR